MQKDFNLYLKTLTNCALHQGTLRRKKLFLSIPRLRRHLHLFPSNQNFAYINTNMAAAAIALNYYMHHDECGTEHHMMDDDFYVPSTNVKPHHHHHHHHRHHHQHHHPNRDRRAAERRAAALAERRQLSIEPSGDGKKSSSPCPEKPSLFRGLFGKRQDGKKK